MAKLLYFKITNFRGIKETTIDIDRRIVSNVITLIGLNESGKTTILEALSRFVTADRSVSDLSTGDETPEEDVSTFIPSTERANFNGEVEITAVALLSPDEIKEILHNFRKEFDLLPEPNSISKQVSVSKSFQFKNSELVKTQNLYGGIRLKVKKSAKSKNFIEYVRPQNGETDAWLYIANTIRNKLPIVRYFPTFLVQIPSKIYLQKTENESIVNRFFRVVIEDALESLGLSVSTHVLDRLTPFYDVSDPAWFQKFGDTSKSQQVDQVFQKLESEINRIVVSKWSNIFKKKPNSRSIKIKWNVDTNQGVMPHISFSVLDGGELYAVEERSLGFRWFFTYLLFTQFRPSRDRSTVFLFDEPAANLHSKAQLELLDSMRSITGGADKVIFSTHSPHMVEPTWLNSAFIVQNKNTDFESDDNFGYNAGPTDIIATRYPNFVSEFPEKETYFQPIWEKLLYEVPPIRGQAPFVLVEGITDFHFFKTVEYMRGKAFDFTLLPGLGAGAFGATISSLIASGEKFLVVLDDDDAGRSEKERYRSKGILSDEQVFVYGDLSAKWKDRKLEQIFDEQTKELVAARFEGSRGKKQIALYLAEAAAAQSNSALSDLVRDAGLEILTECEKNLGKLKRQ